MKIEVAVSRADIDKGGIGDSDKCAVALAAKRALKSFGKIECYSVSGACIDLLYDPPKGFEGETSTSITPPASVKKFIDKFDAIGGERAEVKKALAKLKPFAFVLKVPDEWFPAKGEKTKKSKKKSKK